jgi:UDP-N-acetylmuramyl pentapeptide phosphotransferase/UDP-N-acetylglucosamine-1-phosphate transferase
MVAIIPAFLTAFLITYFAIPSIIRIAIEKNLVDEPGERRSHSQSVPTLGGLGIFAGLIFATTFWIPFDFCTYPDHKYVQYMLCAFLIIFLIGAKDDIIPLSPIKKIGGQVLAAFMLVYYADIRISNLYGILGIQEIPPWLGFCLTIFSIIVIINALNLIDGINGLSGTIGIIICLTFGGWFYLAGRLDLAVLAAAMAGALVAFLRYNIASEIFMGDTGSLLVGLAASILALSFIQANTPTVATYEAFVDNAYSVESVPAVAIGILIIPLFDTLRVFTLRVLKRRSPFSPDRTHIHHLLLDLGCSHLQATAILGLVNIVFVVLVFQLQSIGTLELMLLVFGLAISLTGLVQFLLSKQKKEQHA